MTDYDEIRLAGSLSMIDLLKCNQRPFTFFFWHEEYGYYTIDRMLIAAWSLGDLESIDEYQDLVDDGYLVYRYRKEDGNISILKQ